MKKLSFLLLSFFVFPYLLSFRSGDPVLLRLHLKEGITYQYNTTYDQTVVTHVTGQVVEAKVNMNAGMNMDLTHAYKADSMLADIRYNYIAYHIASKGKENTFDSRNPDNDSNRQIGDFIHAMKTNPITVKTNSRGQVLDIRGMDKVRNALGEVSDDKLRKRLDKMLDEATFKNNFTKLGAFPEKPVAIGDQWDRSISMENVIAIVIHTTYTVIDIQPEKVMLMASSDISSPSKNATFNGISLPVAVSGHQNGTFTIDRESGLFSTGNIDQKMTLKMEMMGQTMNIDITGKYNLDMKKK